MANAKEWTTIRCGVARNREIRNEEKRLGQYCYADV